MSNTTKGFDWSEEKGNTRFCVKDNLLYIVVDLDGETLESSKGNPMAAKGFVNITYNGARVWGGLNLNRGIAKAVLREENADLKARIAELEKQLAK